MTTNWHNQNQSPILETKWEIAKIHIGIIQRKHMANRVSSSFPKGGHSATLTELHIIVCVHIIDTTTALPPWPDQ